MKNCEIIVSSRLMRLLTQFAEDVTTELKLDIREISLDIEQRLLDRVL